jgi:thiamine pyrophosphate-dependent acetolactate synthase large subunit-like protein
VAEKLGGPIVKAMLGKDAVPDDSPYCLGGLGRAFGIATAACAWRRARRFR